MNIFDLKFLFHKIIGLKCSGFSAVKYLYLINLSSVLQSSLLLFKLIMVIIILSKCF